MATNRVREIQPTEHGWESTYPELAENVLLAAFDWLKRNEEELLEAVEDSVHRLNQELPAELKISLVRNYSNLSYREYDEITDEALGIFDTQGIRIFLTPELRSDLTSRSTEEAIELIVQIASDIIQHTPSTQLTFRENLRNKLGTKYILVD